MTDLDKALEAWQKDPEEQNAYYNLLLNTTFYIPTFDKGDEEGALAENDSFEPMFLEADGDQYMMLFDSQERLSDWAKDAVPFVALPGYAIASITPAEIFWAVNVGTEFQKQCVPDEIKWLKEVVEQCEAESSDGE